MRFSKETKRRLGRLGGRFLAQVIKFVRRTSTVIVDPPDVFNRLLREHPVIIGLWHGQFMMSTMHRPKGPRIAAMVARHGDAELIGVAIEKLGLDLVRGAGAGRRRKDRGGATALRGALHCLQSGKTFAMTADVPPGPARVCGEGIVTLAKMSGRPIVPLAVASSRYFALDTWSRLTINLPFSKLAYVYGDAIYVPADATPETLELYRRQVEQALNNATARAYALAGSDPSNATPRTTDMAERLIYPGWALKIYSECMRSLHTLAPAFLKFRARRGKEDNKRIQERLGKPSLEKPNGPLVWIHAASVGEINAALPLIHRLAEMRTDLSFLITTSTVTSTAFVEKRLPLKALHQYVPLDTPQAAECFLRHWKPDLVIFTESEIWPNLILKISQLDIPLALINARMSSRSERRWRKRRNFALPLFSRFKIVLAQNELLARCFSFLGARLVMVTGNLKIDAPALPINPSLQNILIQKLKGREILVAASTHQGEEQIVAEAHNSLKGKFPNLCTIIVPRHPDRGNQIRSDLLKKEMNVAQRSRDELPDQKTDIFLADSIGELGTYFSLGKIVFIGGTLVEHGGQNPVEAIRHNCVVISGPSNHNFQDIYKTLFSTEAAIEVATCDELISAIEIFLSNKDKYLRVLDASQKALLSLSGALNLTTNALLPLLPPAPNSISNAAAYDADQNMKQRLLRVVS